MARSYDIGVIPGDGTGPEQVREALRVLDAAEARYGFATVRTEYDVGYGRYERTGDVLPDGLVDELRTLDAVLFGSVGTRYPGDPVPQGILERGLLLRLRFELDLYVNLRPVKLYPGVRCPVQDKGPEHVDFVVVRENTEGLYAGVGGFLNKGTADEVALQTSVNTRRGVERVVRYAFECARRRPRRKLTLCAKTNVLTYAHDLWDRVFRQVATEYGDVETDYAHVDALCFWMVQSPESYDVIVTDNQLGDIITDLGAALQGGMGVASSANLNPAGVCMFESIGGTAPQFTGTDQINPMAAIGAVRMMLETLGESDAAAGVDAAMASTFPRMRSMDAGQMGFTTTEVGETVAAAVAGD